LHKFLLLNALKKAPATGLFLIGAIPVIVSLGLEIITIKKKIL